MSRRISILVAALLVLSAMAAMAADPLGSEKNPIIWAYVPSGDTTKVSAGAQSVADLLHAKTGLFFKTFVATDYVGVESFQIQPGQGFDSDADRPRSMFRAFDVAGVPIYCDPYCPEGTLYLLNSNYLNLYVHDQASFAFTGFESLLSNYQLGYVGAVLTLCELVETKPKTGVKVTGLTAVAI